MPIKPSTISLLLTLPLACITGCAGLTVKGSSQAKPGVDFSEFKSYSWVPNAGQSKDPRLQSATHLDPQVRKHVDARLASAVI